MIWVSGGGVDTENKRRSVWRIPGIQILPVPDDNMTAADRMAITQYRLLTDVSEPIILSGGAYKADYKIKYPRVDVSEISDKNYEKQIDVTIVNISEEDIRIK